MLMYEKKVLSEDDLLHHLVDNDGIGLVDLRNYDVPEEFRKEPRPRRVLGDVDGALRQGGELLFRRDRLLSQPRRALLLGEAARQQHHLVRHHPRGHLRFSGEDRDGPGDGRRRPRRWPRQTCNRFPMALGKVQQQIIAKLGEMDRLSAEQQDTILATPGDLTGDALDKLLQDEYRISDFQLLVAKARAHGLAPCNVQRFQIGPTTFERIPQDFCQQNLVLPLGQVGNYLLVAFANPFEVAIVDQDPRDDRQEGRPPPRP